LIPTFFLFLFTIVANALSDNLLDVNSARIQMDQASEAKFLASRKDFLTLDSTSLNRNQEIKFGNGRGNELAFELSLMSRSFYL
jgi:hypothetical protein